MTVRQQFSKMTGFALALGVCGAMLAPHTGTTTLDVVDEAPAIQPVSAESKTTLKRGGLNRSTDRPSFVVKTNKRVVVGYRRASEPPRRERGSLFEPGNSRVELPKIREGGSAAWVVTAYQPRTNRVIQRKQFRWINDLFEVKLRYNGFGETFDVYATVVPFEGRDSVEVDMFNVRLVHPEGFIRQRAMIHAYTADDGTEVYTLEVTNRKVQDLRVIVRGGSVEDEQINGIPSYPTD